MERMVYLVIEERNGDEFTTHLTLNKKNALAAAMEHYNHLSAHDKKLSNIRVEGRTMNIEGSLEDSYNTYCLEDDRAFGDCNICFDWDYIDSLFKHPYIVRVYETGDEIEWAETPSEAQQILVRFESEDRKEGVYEDNCYELAVWDSTEMRYVPYTYDNKIRSARIKAGLSQSQLAEASDTSVRTIQDWESCRRIPRDVYVLRDAAKALGCHIEDLID